MENLPPNILKKIVKVASPKSSARLATASRKMYAATKNTLKARQTLARLLRARMHRVRRRTALADREVPQWPYNYLGRLNNNLFEAKLAAIRRSRMTPAQRRAILSDPLKKVRAAEAAYWRYASAPRNRKQAAWNTFVRVHVKAGRNPNVTERQAWNIYFHYRH